MFPTRYPMFTKTANVAVNMAHGAPIGGVTRGLAYLAAAGLGAGGNYAYQRYQALQKEKEEKRQAELAAKNPLSGLNKFIAPERQGATGIGALLGAGLGGYMMYNRDQDPQSALLGALGGAGIGGMAGYYMSPFLQQQDKEVTDMSKQLPPPEQKSAAARSYIDEFWKLSRKHTPIVSEQQRKFFGAVASGKAKNAAPGLSQAEAKRHLAESKGKDLPRTHHKKSDLYINEFLKVANGDYEYDLRRELNDDDKNAILTYLKLMQDLDDGKFHTFVVGRGLHPSAAESYVYQIAHGLLQEEKKETPAEEPKMAGGSKYLDSLLKVAEGDMGAPMPSMQRNLPAEDPSIQVQLLDFFARHPYLTAAAAMVPAAALGYGAGSLAQRGYGALRGFAQPGAPMRTLSPLIAGGFGAAAAGIPAGLLASDYAQYALNNPSVDLDLQGALYNSPQPIDYVR